MNRYPQLDYAMKCKDYGSIEQKKEDYEFFYAISRYNADIFQQQNSFEVFQLTS